MGARPTDFLEEEQHPIERVVTALAVLAEDLKSGRAVAAHVL
jgi:hypothetical protein